MGFESQRLGEGASGDALRSKEDDALGKKPCEADLHWVSWKSKFTGGGSRG